MYHVIIFHMITSQVDSIYKFSRQQLGADSIYTNSKQVSVLLYLLRYLNLNSAFSGKTYSLKNEATMVLVIAKVSGGISACSMLSIFFPWP